MAVVLLQGAARPCRSNVYCCRTDLTVVTVHAPCKSSVVSMSTKAADAMTAYAANLHCNRPRTDSVLDMQ